MSKQFVQTKKEKDSPEDWLATSLILGRALGALLKEKEGVCISVVNEIRKFTKAPTLVIYNDGEQVKVEEHFEKVPNGTMVWME